MSSEAKLKNGRRRGSAEGRAIAEDLTAHSAFSKEALDKITQTHGLIEVSDFQDDLQSFAGKFIVLTVGFYIFMTLYYYSQLHWTVVNSLYVSLPTVPFRIIGAYIHALLSLWFINSYCCNCIQCTM